LEKCPILVWDCPGKKTVLRFIAKPGTAAWNCGRAGEKGKTGKGENRNAIHDHP
jgi:hypothetical protein